MMGMLKDKKRIVSILVPVVMGGVYLLICILTANFSVDADEARRAALLDGDIWGARSETPLYLWILQGWRSIIGDSEWALRSLSAIFGAGTIILLNLICKRRLSNLATIFVTFLWAFSPILFFFGRRISPVTMLAFLVLLASYVEILIMRKWRGTLALVAYIIVGMPFRVEYFAILGLPIAAMLGYLADEGFFAKKKRATLRAWSMVLCTICVLVPSFFLLQTGAYDADYKLLYESASVMNVDELKVATDDEDALAAMAFYGEIFELNDEFLREEKERGFSYVGEAREIEGMRAAQTMNIGEKMTVQILEAAE